jgi:uncharacterized damage-inducible protein DinB
VTLATHSERALFLDQFHRAFHGGAWHGPALSEVIAGVDAEAAAWKPQDAAHSIAEIVGHIAFWMEDTRRRIVGDRAGGAPEADWPALDWPAAVAALEAAQKGLAAALEGMDDARLDDPVPGTDPTLRGLLLGLLQHTAYHAGQASLLRRQAMAIRGGP